MNRWHNFDFGFLKTINTGGNPTPYFSVYYISQGNSILRTNCNDVVTRNAKYNNDGNTVFLIRSMRGRVLNTKVFNSVFNMFNLINKHYQLSEEDCLNVWKTDDSKFLEISCGAWWQKNLMRKMLMFKLIRFAYNYKDEYKTETKKEIEETIINIVTHYANEFLLKDYRKKPYQHHENRIVSKNLNQIINMVLHCYKIPHNLLVTSIGFITHSAISEIHEHLMRKNFYE